MKYKLITSNKSKAILPPNTQKIKKPVVLPSKMNLVSNILFVTITQLANINK